MLNQKSLILVCLLFALSGCVLAPFMEPFRQAGVSAAARRGLLMARVELFHRLWSQNKIEEALLFTDESDRAALRATLEALSDGFVVTGAEVKKRADEDDAAHSVLRIEIQRYKLGRNVIENIPITEQWTFSHTSGWMLVSLISEQG